MGNPITALSEFTDPVTSPATNEPANEATFLAGLQALTNRTRFLKDITDEIGLAAQYVIGAGPFDDDDPLTLTVLAESNGDYGLAFGALVVVPAAGVYKVTVSASLKSTDVIKPAPVGIAVKVGAGLDVMARFKSYRYTTNPDYPVQVAGSVLLYIDNPGDSPIAFYAISGDGDLAPTADRSRVVIARVSALPDGASASDPEDAPDAEPDPDEETTSLQVWMADVPPLTPHALDEEFDSTLSGSWLETDNPSLLSHSIVDGHLRLAFANDVSPPRSAFLTKAYSLGSEWAVVAKISLYAVQNNYASVGLALTGDLASNPTTAPAVGTYINMGSAGVYTGGVNWTDWDSVAGGLGAGVGSAGFVTTAYLRIRVSGTSYYFDVSSDGRGWVQTFAGTLPFAPARIGFIGEAQGGNPCTADIEFLRFKEGAGEAAFIATTIGRRV